MKYKFDKREFFKDTRWINELDGEVMESSDNSKVLLIGDKCILKRWCIPVIDEKPNPNIGRKKILIETDGDITTAKLIKGKETVAFASTRRNSHDEPDIRIGMKLALERLLDIITPKEPRRLESYSKQFACNK